MRSGLRLAYVMLTKVMMGSETIDELKNKELHLCGFTFLVESDRHGSE